MDPQVAGSLRSILQFGLGAVGSYLVTKGVITSDQAMSLAPEIAGAVFTIGGAALAVYSGRQHSQPNLIQAVNGAQNGVSVVPTAKAEAAGIAPVDQPIPVPPGAPK